MLGRIVIHRNQTLLHGEEYQVGIALQVEGFHDVMFVELDRLLAQIQVSQRSAPLCFWTFLSPSWTMRNRHGTEKVGTILVLSVADLSAVGRALVVVDLILVRINNNGWGLVCHLVWRSRSPAGLGASVGALPVNPTSRNP